MDSADETKASGDAIDPMKLRGALGIVGQSLMIASGLRRGEGLKVWSASTSMLANAINLHYGVQKKDDAVRLEEAKRALDAVIGRDTPTDASLPPPSSLLGEADALMQRHSVRISDGIKFISKYLFRLAGIEAENSANTWHGNLSMAAKVMTMVGKDEDPYTPDAQKPVLHRVREMSNLLSGGMELVGQYPLFPGALNRLNRRTGKPEHDWLQLGAAGFFTAALVAKTRSPFTLTTIDRAVLYEYAAAALAKLPEAQQRERLPQVVACLGDALDREADLRNLPDSRRVSETAIEANVLERLSRPAAHVSEGTYEGSLAGMGKGSAQAIR